MKAIMVIAATVLLGNTGAALAHSLPCATEGQKAEVRSYYADQRPGVPLAVASRHFDYPELVIASGLPAEQSFGTAATPETTRKIWDSIDAWGAKTEVRLVLTPNSEHAFAFPSLVPVTQPDEGDGYLDVYADEGRGVHSHIQLDRVAAIFASDIPVDMSGKRTQAISLFGHDGDLILGVYATIRGEEYEGDAVAGFERTRDLIGSMPRICE